MNRIYSALLVETTDLDEAGAALLKVGMPVNVRVNAFADKTLPGKIGEIAPLATTTVVGEANYTVRIALDGPDPALRLGMAARVEFPVNRWPLASAAGSARLTPTGGEML